MQESSIMKKIGIINAPLSKLVARLGHTDKLIICDSGLPIPKDAKIIDLAVSKNVPRFTEVLKVVLEELVVEKYIVAEELFNNSEKSVSDAITKMANGIFLEKVNHDKFKKIINEGNNSFFVRTGEMTPYANIILVCGVAF